MRREETEQTADPVPTEVYTGGSKAVIQRSCTYDDEY